MEIDIERLREALKNECLGAFYGGGFGGALIESFNINKASTEELIQIAQRMNIDLNNYIIYDNKRK